MAARPSAPTREEKLLNLMFNSSMLMMASFEGAFTEAVSGMTEALVDGTNAMAEALTDGLGGTSQEPQNQKAPKRSGKAVASEVSKGVVQMFSEMRKQMSANVPIDNPSFKEFMNDPAFDKGLSIVESHEFKLPNLTERLGDGDLASYLILLKNGNPDLASMFQELGGWQKGLPQFPG